MNLKIQRIENRQEVVYTLKSSDTGMKLLSRLLYPAFTLLFLWLLVPCGAWAQPAGLTKLVDDFQNYTGQHYKEKIFVHTDRGCYLSGETLWFKIYTVSASDHTPSLLSKVAYVEVLDKDNAPVLQAKITLERGQGSGSFDIGNEIGSGNYLLRVYTRWMRNDDPGYFFQQQLTIINTSKENTGSPSPGAEAMTLQFFPEGGNLVYGLSGKVGFKMTDHEGKGSDFTGFILNQHNDTLLRFQPLKSGIGSFMFTPDENFVYRAFIVPAGKGSFTQELPAIMNTGYSIRVYEEAPGTIKIDVTCKTNNPPEAYAPVYLIAHTRQRVKAAEVSNLNNGKTTFLIDKEKLGPGISHLTIFNKDKRPLCERLYFKYPEEELLFDISAERQEFKPREKVSLTISAQNEQGTAEQPAMSLSVFLTDSLDQGPANDIRSYLWLSSDLKGYIEDPSWYFDTTGNEVGEALDNLLLTQGWRRFRWEEVLDSKEAFFTYAPEYNEHLIQASVLDLNTRKAAENRLVYLSSAGKPGMLYAGMTDKRGEVIFPAKDLYGKKPLILQAEHRKDSSVCSIELMSPFSTAYEPFPITNLQFTPNLRKSLLDRMVNADVRKAFHPELSARPTGENAGLAFYSEPDKRYYLDDYTRFTAMEEVMREYIPEVYVRKRKESFYFMVSNSPFNRIFDAEPLVLLDGVPVQEVDKIMAFDPLKIEKLEVISQRYFYGPLNLSGIVSYNTYKGDLAGFKLDPDAVVVEYEGLQSGREFYSPQYLSDSSRASRIPDFRNLLYWSPELNAGTDGKSKVHFYTSGQQGKYTVLIQGLSKEGRAGSRVIRFEVKED